jgi:DNA-binding transcriptional ArsR family regulator
LSERSNGATSFTTLYARIVHELAADPCVAQETLARKLGVTMRTVQRHLAQLEDDGYIRVRRDGKPFVYEVVWDRPLPQFGALSLALFRPETVKKVSAMLKRDRGHR